MKAYLIVIISLFFALGWFSNSLLTDAQAEKPSAGTITGDAVSQLEVDKPSPGYWVTEDKIHVYNDKIVIYVDSPLWAKIADTKSMDPVIDSGSYALQVKPKRPEDIHEGDIISFVVSYDSSIIIHRVIETGYDEDGWYAITKGDNNRQKDPSKVRFKDVRKVLIGIIY